jgi:PAS domain S-box-containing protein
MPHTRTTLRRYSDVRKSSAFGLFETWPEAIVVFDHAGRILDMNPAAGTLFGYRLDEAMGQPVSLLMDTADLIASQNQRSKIAAHVKGGDSRMTNAEVIKLASGEGSAACWSIVIHDDGAVPEGSAAPAAQNAPPAQGRSRANRDFRILLIDDNVDANESMASLLRLLDYDVRTACDGVSGLAAAQEFEPHLILSDIGMPGMDGYTLAPALRAAAGERKMVIAAATGYGGASDRERARAAGFDYHLVKPLDADALLEFVAQQVATY